MSRRNTIRRTLESLEPRAMLAWKVLEAGEQLVIGEPNDGDTGVLSYDPELNEYVLDGVATGVVVDPGGSQANVVVRAGNAEGTTFVFDESQTSFPRGHSCFGPGCFPDGLLFEYDGGNRDNNLTVVSDSHVRVEATQPETGNVFILSSARHRLAYSNLGGTLHIDGAPLSLDARQVEEPDRQRWVNVEAGHIVVKEYFPIEVVCLDPPTCREMIAPTVENLYTVLDLTYENARIGAIFTGAGDDEVRLQSSFVHQVNQRAVKSSAELLVSLGEGNDYVSVFGTDDADWIRFLAPDQPCQQAEFVEFTSTVSCRFGADLVADPFLPGEHLPRLNEPPIGGLPSAPQRPFFTVRTADVESTIVSAGMGDDVVIGSNVNDLIWGGVGDDKIVGRGGDDAIVGGGGTDSLAGGDGDDALIAGEMAPLGEIRCAGVSGGFRCAIPFLTRRFGNNVFYIDPARDTPGNDVLLGGEGDDEIFGSAGDNRMDGGAGNDVLIGGEGADQLNGGTGRNVVIGGADRDTIQTLGSDLIVTGSTAHDVDAEALRDIRAEWTSSRSLARRIANLRSGASEDRANGDTFLNDATLSDDRVVDRVYARRSVDWLLADDGDLINLPGVPPRDRRDRPRLPLRAIVERRGLPVPPQQAPANLLAQHQPRRLER